MPLARIVTRFSESSLAASDYFRSRGYTVEVVAPGDFRVTPAVVELKLDKCSPNEALLRAQEALGEVEVSRKAEALPQTSVVASEAATPEESPEVLAYDIAGRPVLFAERRRAPSSFRGALVSLLRRAWSDTGSRLPDALRALGIGAPRRSKKRMKKRVRRIAPARSAVVTQIPTGTTSEADNLARAAAERDAAELESRARIAAREAEKRERVRLLQETEAAAEREQQRIAAAAREAEVVRQREHERIAIQRAAEERVRLQREAEASAELERLRIVGEAELARQREREQVRMFAQLAAGASQPHAYRRRKTDLPPQGWERQLNPVRESEWKKAFAAAGAVAVLVTAGILAFSNRRPAQPLSQEDLNRSQMVDQQTPFGGATINPASTAAVQPQKPTPAVVPAIQKPAPTRPAVNHSAKTPRRSSVYLRRSSPEEEQVADDQVVVRRFQQTQSVLKSAASPGGGGIKQISDVN